jgi:Tol biopolymer transport system component
LTSGTDGTDSVGPVWSPDGTRLLFARLAADATSLWAMDADVGNQQKLINLPNAESVGGYAWGTAPRN